MEQAKKDCILIEAARAFSRFGFRKTSVDEIAKAAGVVALTASILAQSSVLAAAAERSAAFVIDANNGKVLYSKFADDLRFPASLTKMMTLYMLFDAMEAGRTTLKTPMKVSSYAAARPPTSRAAGSPTTAPRSV